MARRRLGQHFLIRPSILERIASAACPEAEPLVIEIGPGKGALTSHLLRRAEHLIAIEIDKDLAAHLAEAYAEEPRLTVIAQDILATDLRQWPATVIAGNLPYYITSPILEKVLPLGPPLRRAVFLVQKEVAERITARPGSRDYGYLSVFTRFYSRPEMLFKVPPGAFSPPPKVDSAVVRLTIEPAGERLGITDASRFLTFLRACFAQKRKTLRNNLSRLYGQQALDAQSEAGLRAEQLSLEQFADLYQRLEAFRADS